MGLQGVFPVRRVCNLVAEVNNQNACTVGEKEKSLYIVWCCRVQKKRWIATLAITSGASQLSKQLILLYRHEGFTEKYTTRKIHTKPHPVL